MIPCWKTIVIELAALQVLSVNVVQTEKLQNISCFIIQNINISERTLLIRHWIYWNVRKSPVCQTVLNFCYFLQSSTVSPSLRTELLKIYCLNFFRHQTHVTIYCHHLHFYKDVITADGLYIGFYQHIAVSSLYCLHREVTVPSCLYLWFLPRCYRACYRSSLKIYNNNNNIPIGYREDFPVTQFALLFAGWQPEPCKPWL